MERQTESMNIPRPGSASDYYCSTSTGTTGSASYEHHRSSWNQNLAASVRTTNFVDPALNRDQLEHLESDLEPNVGELGVFGDFCLMCGQMIDGVSFEGSAYCSEECEYHQLNLSDSEWCDLSLEGYQIPSFGGSTAVSSARSSPLNSPHLPPSDRLAILCSGPPPLESLLPLDLGERLLGSKAVAQQYLDQRPRATEDEIEEDDANLQLGDCHTALQQSGPVSSSLPSFYTQTEIDSTLNPITIKKDTSGITPGPSSSSSFCSSSSATPSPLPPSPSTTSHSNLKSRPALALLTNVEQLGGLTELSKVEESNHRSTIKPNRRSSYGDGHIPTEPITFNSRSPPPLSSTTLTRTAPTSTVDNIHHYCKNDYQSNTKLTRRTSDPIYRQTGPCSNSSCSITNHSSNGNGRKSNKLPVYNSSLSITSLSSLSSSSSSFNYSNSYYSQFN